MFRNGLSYAGSITLLLLTHTAMLGVVLARGAIAQMKDFILLAAAVIGLDVIGIIVFSCYRQMTYTLDLMLLCILNMSLIFQSCFGKVSLSVKHLLFCIGALVACEVGFLLTRNHEWIRKRKKYIYVLIVLLMLSIVFLTNREHKWIVIGGISIQPSEFIKPCFVLVCAASIVELHKKVKVLFFYVSKDTLCLCALTLFILGLQWWSHDLGSLPTFAAVFVCALVFRLCYPRAKINKTAIIAMCAAGVVVLAAAWMLAPAYVQRRLHVDIWADRYGDGYQQCEALIGAARGGWLGLGPGKGNLCHVFAYDSDIVFTSICEEWGLFFASLTVIIILIMLMTCLMNPPKSYYHATMTAGVTAVFLAQMALNIFGSCNLIPFTGVTLPFLSQGGSSMITCGFLVGMLKAGQSPLFRHETPRPKKPSTKPPSSTKSNPKMKSKSAPKAKSSKPRPIANQTLPAAPTQTAPSAAARRRNPA